MEITDMTKEEILKLTTSSGAYEFGRQKGYRYGFEQGAKAARREDATGVNASLQHYYDTTVGLWCIDKDPHSVNIGWVKKNAFQIKKFEIKENK